MTTTGLHPGISQLKQFPSLDELTPEQKKLLVHAIFIYHAKKNEQIIKYGSEDEFSYFLLDGELELHAPDGCCLVVTAGTDSASCPIAHLLPRQYDIIAHTNIEFLKIDNMMLKEFLDSEYDVQQAAGVSLSFVPSDIEESEHELAIKIKDDLDKDRLLLPSLPEFAKLVKAANSALYAGQEPVDTCASAIVRLGINATHKLVLSFALRELFYSRNCLMQKYMHQVWRHSAEVGALCFILARFTNKFDPEKAMLAGLLHDIGVVAILSYAQKYPGLTTGEHDLDHVVNLLRGVTGKTILQKWGFPDDLVVAAAESEEWNRNPAQEPDICDLVIIAQLHSYVGTPMMQKHPCMIDIPCFTKLDLGGLTPKMSLKILDEAVDKITQAELLLQ